VWPSALDSAPGVVEMIMGRQDNKHN
jgi:hypothetical protein